MRHAIGLHSHTTTIQTGELCKLLELSEALLRGDYSKRIITDFNDDLITKIAANLNQYLDRMQLDPKGASQDQDEKVTNFIEVISSYTNLDFKQKLPISENGTIWDAIATGINIMGDELENSTASKAELEEERNRLNEAQAIAKVGSWQLDLNTMKVTLSKEASRIFELELIEDSTSNSSYEIYRRKIHPEDLAQCDEMFHRAQLEKKGFSFHHRLICSDGQIRNILCLCEVVNASGDAAGYMKGTVQDITERKLVEKALSEAKEKAEESNKAKSRFLANMSHEIRTPLNGILGLTDVLLGENVQEDHRKYLELIRDSGENLAQLINDILDLSKIESGTLKLESIPFDFREAINTNINPYKFLAEQKGLTLSCLIDGSIPDKIIGDPTRISQVLINLIGNAIKFTAAGSIQVIFSVIDRKLDDIVVQGTVKDSGIGIPKDKQDTIFQNFTQVDESVTRKYGGTGLGLSIVKSLVNQMNGEVTVSSPVDTVTNIGTVFTFRIKLKTPPAATPKSAPVTVNADQLSFGKAVHVLVVDDNSINLLVAKKMLQKLGANVTTAETGMEGIEIAMRNNFDLILMDIQMPGLTGHETTVQLRRLDYKKPIIALSANAFKEDIEKSLTSGMNGHMQKPFTERELYTRVSEAVAKSQS
jgi:signal transduction histidine kinase/CheY-like chemotaxis protein